LSLISVITVNVLLIYGNTMKIFDIVQKIASLLVAAAYIFYVIYCHPASIFRRLRSPVLIVWEILAWLGISLAFIWFSEDVSEWLEKRQWKDTSDWTPPGLVRFAGWVFLLLPAIIQILVYYKVLELLSR
jgi:hypothetical protein